jgi:hypothetical protein
MDGGNTGDDPSEPATEPLKQILDRNRWIGLPFVVGSVLFIIAVPVATNSILASALLFFVGSTLYLIGASADAWNARATALNGARWRASVEAQGSDTHGWTKYLRHRFWASSIQAFGAVLFQVMVIAGLIPNLTPLLVDIFIWEPDIVGSLCFVVSSAMLVSVTHPLAGRGDFRDRIKGASLFNLAGSLCFLASSIGAFVPLSSGEEISPILVGGGTMVGGLFFLIGSWPGLPERLRSSVSD